MADREFKGGGAAAAVSGTLSSGATTITLTATPSGWPSGTGADTFVVVIDRGLATEEKVLIESISGAILTVASSGRGYDGTSAQSHAASATVELCLDAVWLQEINEHYNDTTLDHHTQYLTTGRHDVTARHVFGSAFATPSAPPSIGTSNSAGAAAGPARSDHTHEIGSGAIDGSAMFAAGVVNSAAIADLNVTTAKIADDAVTAGKIAAAVAGAGLAGGSGTALSVNVDDSTLEISSDLIRVKDSGITVAKLAAAVQALLLPPGLIAPYGASTAPTGWLLCDGSAVSRSTYAALFAVLSTEFGAGNGSTTFNVPDLRGRAAVGLDNLGGTAASRITSAIAGLDGTDLGAAGGDQRLHGHTHTGPSHTHTITDPTHAHTNLVGGSGSGLTSAVGFGDGANTATVGTNFSSTGITATNAGGTGNTGSTGGGSTQNVQPSLIVGYIIKT